MSLVQLFLGLVEPRSAVRDSSCSIWKSNLQADLSTHPLSIEGQQIPVYYRFSNRGRRYRLQIDRWAKLRVTIPKRGSRDKAMEFIKQQEKWILKHWQRRSYFLAEMEKRNKAGRLLFRGKLVEIKMEERAQETRMQLGSEAFLLKNKSKINSAREVKFVLQNLAEKELPARTMELAQEHQVTINGVQVRDQRSRWGSCSARGMISLNWRLIQAPPLVQDYLILHELMHRREMNHSSRYWRLVAKVCPAWKEAETWLKQHDYLLWDSFS